MNVELFYQVSLVFLQWLPRLLVMHRPCTNHLKPSEDTVRPSIDAQEGDIVNTQLRSTKENVEQMSVGLSQCSHNKLMDTEPRLLLHTLLDWEDDYVPPPHVCHQWIETYLDPGEEVVNQMMGASNCILWENPSAYDIMRELGNILKVAAFIDSRVEGLGNCVSRYFCI